MQTEDMKLQKVVKFLNECSKHGSLSKAATSILKTNDALFAFEKLGLCKKEYGQWRFTRALADFDETTVRLMAMENWYIKKDKKEKNIPPPAENVSPMPPITITEDIAKQLAKLGDMLGYQFGGKTPPGLWQRFAQLENDLSRVRKERDEAIQDLESIMKFKEKYKK